MEDAMIINKHSYERGWGHASVYKYKSINLTDSRTASTSGKLMITNKAPPTHAIQQAATHRRHAAATHGRISDKLDIDGLPSVGSCIRAGDLLYAVLNDTTHESKLDVYKDVEDCYIEDIRVLGDPSSSSITSVKDEKAKALSSGSSSSGFQHVGIKFRINRNPVVGDKFASRAGQKGVLSILYPAADMPFTDSGMQPDVIINPHAFPSRMTVGMLIESMAGKSGALNGRFQDATAFRFDEKHTAVEYFGKQLVHAGYAYSGTEAVYSGISGQIMQADIFVGLVYYQRLRHMVSDKSQVRSTGPINAITRQPIKGRKVHGGIRFGEMERDSLLAHGVAYMLHDRLMNCSDYHTTSVCTLCGSLLSPSPVSNNTSNPALGGVTTNKRMNIVCRLCETSKGCATVAVPYVFMYLINELAAMNIKLTMDVKQV
jgi:DNA-directed RNA polymerase I subunit RPA2